MRHYCHCQTPIGQLTLTQQGQALVELSFEGSPDPADGVLEQTPLLTQACRQLTEYFAGERTTFDLPLAPVGTPFQQAVWAQLQAIPYGQTQTYAQVAAAVDRPKAYRAVGMANHHNPLAIVIPCHRVVGTSGSLTGYAGGLDIKKRLLQLEQGAKG